MHNSLVLNFKQSFMKHLIIITLLLISANSFSQDSVYPASTETSDSAVIVLQPTDNDQLARIINLEKRLGAYYTYNRRSQTFIYVGWGLALAGVILNNKTQSTFTGMVLPLAGCVVSLFGTVAYLESFKFLNFNPRRRETREMIYY